jgi:dCMP deaminase
VVERLTKAEFRIMQTFVYSMRGTCDRLRTATTLWTPEPKNKLLSGGYNGSPSGHASCDDLGVGHRMVEGHCIRTTHGEMNAKNNCHDLSRLSGATATILGTPCYPCARELIDVGIMRFEYIGIYKNALGANYLEDLFEESCVAVNMISIEEMIRILQKGFEFAKGPGGPLKGFPDIRIEGV